MVPTAIRKDPLTQYLLAFSLVIVIVGSVGAVAQILHFEELPSLAYTATILVPAILFVVAAVLYNRLFDAPTVPASSEDSDVQSNQQDERETSADERNDQPESDEQPESPVSDDDTIADESPAPDEKAITDDSPVPEDSATDEIEPDTKQSS